MYLKNETLRQGYRMLFLFLCEMGMVLQYAIVARIGDIGILSCYYTMLSNMVCFLYFGYLVLRRPEQENPMLKGAVTVCIVVTGLVYHFMLNGAMEAGVGAVGEVTFTDIAANTLVHYIVPTMTVLDYLLFAPKGAFRWWHPFTWIAAPAVYAVFVLIRAEVSSKMFAGFSGPSRYPYPFVDVDLFGFGTVLLMIAGILLAFLLLGYVLLGLDRLLGRKRK